MIGITSCSNFSKYVILSSANEKSKQCSIKIDIWATSLIHHSFLNSDDSHDNIRKLQYQEYVSHTTKFIYCLASTFSMSFVKYNNIYLQYPLLLTSEIFIQTLQEFIFHRYLCHVSTSILRQQLLSKKFSYQFH